MNFRTCKCGQSWVLPCRCPANMLKRFGKSVFYYGELSAFVTATYGYENPAAVDAILNSEGVMELGDSAYQTII